MSKITKTMGTKTRLKNKERLHKMAFLQTEVILMELKYREKEGLKMITGVETSTANIVTNSIYHTQPYIPTLNKSTARVLMDKLYLYLQVAGEEADLRKILIKDMTQNQKNSLEIQKGKEVP